MKTMLAARLHVPTSELRMEEIPVPAPGAGQALIKIEAAGVCLSDVHLIEGVLKPGLLDGDVVTLGHEVAGTIAELGTDVSGWELGDRVLLQAGEIRGGATFTRGVDYDGGWAEFALAAAETLVRLPDGLPFEQACFIPDAVSTPWAAITRTAQVVAAEAVGVWGIGGLGVHGVQLLRMAGAFPIIAVDALPAARERSLAFGADLALDPADPDFKRAVFGATARRGLDVAFDFAGAAAVREQAASVLRTGIGGRGGRMVLVGLTAQPLTLADGTLFSVKQQQILGHYGSGPEHVEQLVRLVSGGRIEFSRSVSAILPLSEAPSAVEQLSSKEGNPIRLILKP